MEYYFEETSPAVSGIEVTRSESPEPIGSDNVERFSFIGFSASYAEVGLSQWKETAPRTYEQIITWIPSRQILGKQTGKRGVYWRVHFSPLLGAYDPYLD